MKHWDMYPLSTTIFLQTKELHRNRNASCDYTYMGSSEKQEITLQLSQIFRELLIALHVLVLETHFRYGLAPSWVAEKSQLKTGGILTKCCLQRGTILPHSYDACLFSNSKKDSAMAIIHCGMCYHHHWKISKQCLTSSLGGLHTLTYSTLQQQCAVSQL